MIDGGDVNGDKGGGVVGAIGGVQGATPPSRSNSGVVWSIGVEGTSSSIATSAGTVSWVGVEETSPASTAGAAPSAAIMSADSSVGTKSAGVSIPLGLCTGMETGMGGVLSARGISRLGLHGKIW